MLGTRMLCLMDSDCHVLLLMMCTCTNWWHCNDFMGGQTTVLFLAQRRHPLPTRYLDVSGVGVLKRGDPTTQTRTSTRNMASSNSNSG